MCSRIGTMTKENIHSFDGSARKKRKETPRGPKGQRRAGKRQVINRASKEMQPVATR